MHDAADNETADSTAGKVQRRALFHARVSYQSSLGEEVGRQLNGATKPRTDHGCFNASVQTPDTLAPIDLRHAVPGIAVVVLRAHGPGRREALQPGLDEEKGAPRGGAQHARRGSAEDVDAEILRLFVLEHQLGQRLAHRLVEA